MVSGYNNFWALSNRQKTYFFECGIYPFSVGNCRVNVSQLTDIHENLDIETYKGQLVESILIDPNDYEKYNARQGQIGNCWFLQILVSLYARYPEVISSKFVKPDIMSKTGIVAVKLWSKELNCWRLIIMDDYLPCYSNSSLNWFGATPSGEHINRYWVPFLEKAFAKQLGGFNNLTAGISKIGLYVEYEMLMGPLYKGFEHIDVPEKDESYVVFEKMLNHYHKGNVISFSSRSAKNNNSMVPYHGYGLLEIRENVHGFTFVKAHNVWSQGGG